jgi:hypothetical protein
MNQRGTREEGRRRKAKMRQNRDLLRVESVGNDIVVFAKQNEIVFKDITHNRRVVLCILVFAFVLVDWCCRVRCSRGVLKE